MDADWLVAVRIKNIKKKKENTFTLKSESRRDFVVCRACVKYLVW